MANLRDIRRRIKSVKSTSQITKAMQLVASAKMKKAQNQALAGRRYAEEMKTHLGIAMGCTGGRHRSVFFAEKVAATLKAEGRDVVVHHRDKDRWRYS